MAELAEQVIFDNSKNPCRKLNTVVKRDWKTGKHYIHNIQPANFLIFPQNSV